jgi:hypothetical protein
VVVSQKDLLPEPDMQSSGPTTAPVCIPVKWGAVSFECGIRILAECGENAPSEPGPVQLRISEAVADCCLQEAHGKICQ